MGLDEQIHQQTIEGFPIGGDPLVAVRLGRLPLEYDDAVFARAVARIFADFPACEGD